MSNQSLVLQRIDRQTAGIYTCLATNIEGQGESNALALPVKCKSSSLSNPRSQKKNEMGSAPNPTREREKNGDPIIFIGLTAERGFLCMSILSEDELPLKIYISLQK
jgi:hypothetical protein